MSHKPLGYYCSAIQVPADIEATIFDYHCKLAIVTDMTDSMRNECFDCSDEFADALTAEQIEWLSICHPEAYKSILKWIVNELI